MDEDDEEVTADIANDDNNSSQNYFEGDVWNEDFQTTFHKILDTFHNLEIIKTDDIKSLIEDLKIRLKSNDVFRQTIFGNDFFVSNTMITCEISKKGGNRDYFDLNKLNNPDDLLCYKKNLPGNMQVMFDDRTPSATFSSFGHMTLIGGKSIDEVALCLSRACHKVMYYERQLDPGSEFKVCNIKIVNRVCVCSLGRNTDLLQVCENAKKMGFDTAFTQHKFPSAYLTPNGNFGLLNKSLRVSIGPSGGVNILGFKNLVEVSLLSVILSQILLPCLRTHAKKRTFTERAYKNKLARKRQKNAKWIKKTTVYRKKTQTILPETVAG